MEFLRFLVIGSIFNKNNEFVKLSKQDHNKFYFKEVTIFEFRKGLRIKITTKNKDSDDNLKFNPFINMPGISKRKWNNYNNDPNNYTDFFLPSIEIIRFFFFVDKKIGNSILFGEYLNDIITESRIVTLDNGRKIGFVTVKETYSEVEKKILAWICLSDLAFKAAKEIMQSGRINSNTNDSKNTQYYPNTYIPTMDFFPMDCFSNYMKNESYSINIISQITSFPNIFPVDEIIYTPFIHHGSIEDEKERALLEEIKYRRYVRQSNNNNTNLTSENTSKQNILPVDLNIKSPAKSFLDLQDIPIRITSKETQKKRYKGNVIIISQNTSGDLTTSKKKEIDATEDEIHSLNDKGHKIRTCAEFIIYLKDVLSILKVNFTIKTLSGNEFIDYSGEIIPNKFNLIAIEFKSKGENKYFYFIEKLIPNRLNRPWLIIYDSRFQRINNLIITTYLSKITKFYFTRESLKIIVEENKMLIRAFYRNEENERKNKVNISSIEMADRITQFININKPKAIL